MRTLADGVARAGGAQPAGAPGWCERARCGIMPGLRLGAIRHVRALHLFADHKITGPAELALETARALRGRGVDATFYSRVVRETPARERALQRLARERGVPEPPIRGVRLTKHLSPARAAIDAWRLAAFLRQDRPDLVHCHLRNDHLVANLASRRRGVGVPIVRTLYDGAPPAPGFRARLTLGGMTARVVCMSEAVAGALRARAPEYGLVPERIAWLEPPIDVVRFDRARVAPRRAALGVPEGAFCLGIVARMQTHRRFELLLEAVHRARERLPELHLVIVGRGTNQETVAREPVRRLGIGDRVHFAGYVTGEDYVATLAAFDAKVFLVPGSDGTCRAVREALAMGVPVVASRRGMLPEIVRDGVDGLLVDETEESLIQAFERLARNPEWRAALARSARAGAVERFSLEKFAERLAQIYGEVVREARSLRVAAGAV